MFSRSQLQIVIMVAVALGSSKLTLAGEGTGKSEAPFGIAATFSQAMTLAPGAELFYDIGRFHIGAGASYNFSDLFSPSGSSAVTASLFYRFSDAPLSGTVGLGWSYLFAPVVFSDVSNAFELASGSALSAYGGLNYQISDRFFGTAALGFMFQTSGRKIPFPLPYIAVGFRIF